MPKVTYDQILDQRAGFTEVNDCGVKALAVACSVTYADAHAALKALGRKDRDGTYRWQMERAARRLGFRLTRVPCEAKTMSSLPAAMRKADMLGHRYIVHATNHFAAFANGKVEDWSSGRRKRVLRVFRVDRLC